MLIKGLSGDLTIMALTKYHKICLKELAPLSYPLELKLDNETLIEND
jgi:hypothetical protein